MKQTVSILAVFLLIGAAGYHPASAADTATLTDLSEAIPTTELGAQAGGEDLTVNMGDLAILHNNLNQSAAAGGNVIQGVTSTGTNYVTDNAFQNATGIANLIQNTGNQVVIQNSMNMNIFVK